MISDTRHLFVSYRSEIQIYQAEEEGLSESTDKTRVSNLLRKYRLEGLRSSLLPTRRQDKPWRTCSDQQVRPYCTSQVFGAMVQVIIDLSML